MCPAFLDRLLRRPEPAAPDVSAAARTLSETRVNRERNRVIDQANAMRAAMGMDTMIPRRPA